MEKLNFAEFSTFPFGSRPEDGPHNGAAFRPILTQRFKESKRNGKYGLEVVMDGVNFPLEDFMAASFGEFAKEMKEQGVDVTPDNLKLSGDHRAYEMVFRIIWAVMEEHKAIAAVNGNGAATNGAGAMANGR